MQCSVMWWMQPATAATTNSNMVIVDLSAPDTSMAIPAGPQGSATNYTVTLGTTDNLTGWTIYWSTNRGNAAIVDQSTTASNNITFYTNENTNWYLLCFAVDGVGNTNGWQTNIYIINTNAPTVSYSPSGVSTFFTNVTLTVQVSVSGGADVNGITKIYTNSVLSNTLTNKDGNVIGLGFVGTNMFVSYATNTNTTLYSGVSTNTYVIETGVPDYDSNNLSLGANIGYTNNSAVSYTNYGSDAISGVESYRIKTNNGSWLSQDNITMSAEGTYAVLSYVIDNAGNVSTTNSNFIMVDLTEPDYDSNNLSLGAGIGYTNNTAVSYTNYGQISYPV